MWTLEHVDVINSEAEGCFLLLPGKYVIGRQEKGCDILCQHVSISRRHAEVTVQKAGDESQGSSLRIKGIASALSDNAGICITSRCWP